MFFAMALPALVCLASSAPAEANGSVWTGFNEDDFSISSIPGWGYYQDPSFLTSSQTQQIDADQGASVDRFGLDWNALEQSAGACAPGGDSTKCYLSEYDPIYTALTGAQPGSEVTSNPDPIRPVIAILTVPTWAYTAGGVAQCQTADTQYNASATGTPCPGWDMQAYADFAATVATRYPLAAAIEVWNEENHEAKEWAGTCPPSYEVSPPQQEAQSPWWCWGPVSYAELLQATYETVHPLTQGPNPSVAPDMKVLLGSLLGDDLSSTNGFLGDGEWLADVYSWWGSGHVYMDGIGVHPYSVSTGDDQMDLVLDQVRDIRDDNNDPARMLYATETGITTTPSSAEPNSGNTTPSATEPVDEAEQAIMVNHIWSALSPQPDIAAVLMHTTIGTGDPTTSAEPGYGLLDNNDNLVQPGVTNSTGWRGSPYRIKPAFCVNAQIHAGRPYSDDYQCPSSVTVPSLTSEPASGNLLAQIDLQAAYEVAREHYHQHGGFDGITNSYVNSRNSTLSTTVPTQPNNPGATADPSEIDIVQASGQTLQICNSGVGNTSYCIVRYSTNAYTYSVPSECNAACSTVSYSLPGYLEAVNPATGERAALTGANGWGPPTGTGY